MPAGLCIKLHTAEDSEKAEEILIFEKCRRTALVHFHRQQVIFSLIYGVRSNSEGVKLSSAYPTKCPFNQTYIACSTPSKQMITLFPAGLPPGENACDNFLQDYTLLR